MVGYCGYVVVVGVDVVENDVIVVGGGFGGYVVVIKVV